MRYFAALTIVLTVALAPGGFAQEKKIKKVEATYTRPDSGPEMFRTYCAVCHGEDGKGNGPAASALKTAPADLTALTQKHNGKFPVLEVQQYIRGESASVAHGSRDMPMWGDVLKNVSAGGDSVIQIRV